MASSASRISVCLRFFRRYANASSSTSPSCALQNAKSGANCYYNWTPAMTSVDRGSAEHWASTKLALGVLAGGTLGALGVHTFVSDPFHCEASELQNGMVPDEINRVPETTNNSTYSLLSDSYRRQVFFNYERRIRLRSRPEKVFSYFASHRDLEGNPYMTPADLMRAIVPIFPPSDSTIIREGHLAGERPPGELSCAPSEFFMLFDTNGDGLISFAEYIFFMTFLSIPEINFRTAFKMFDLNGNGTIDREEFKKVMSMMREKTRQGLAQQSGYHTGLMASTSLENGGVVEYFFGKDGKKELRLEDFEKFLRELHDEMIRLEFAHYDFKQKGTISAYDFSLSMIAAAEMDLLDDYLQRANVLLKDPRYNNVRISYEDFHQFSELRKKLPKLARAMVYYGAMNRAAFQRAASKVCNIPLSDDMVDIVFQIFDTNQDGYLSSEEFLHAMERREHDIANPKDTGIVQFLKCWWSCGRCCQPVLHHSWQG